MPCKTIKQFYELPLTPYIRRDVLYISASATVQEATDMMCKNNLGCLLVTGSDSGLGIITERDVVREYSTELFDFYEEKVGAIMTIHPLTVIPEETLGKAFEIMSKHGFRHLPVMSKGGELVGILSIKDLAQALVDQFKQLKKVPKTPTKKKPSLKVAAKKKKKPRTKKA